MNILEEANNIVNNRTQEKERMYGNFDETMTRCTMLFNLMTGSNMQVEDMYLAMVAMKLAREAHAHKEDNLLDAAAYIGALNNYIQNKKAE